MAGSANGLHESRGASRRCDLTGKSVAESDALAIDGESGIHVLLNDGAFQREAGEDTLGARVSQHFGVQLPVSSGRRMTSHGTRCYRPFSSQGEFAGKK